MAFKINFHLKPFSDIVPFGNDVHYFALTDSIYTYTVGNTELLKYKNPEYVNDYYLERFIDDFLSIAEFISVSVSPRLYRLIKNNSMDIFNAIEDFIMDYENCIDGTTPVMGKTEQTVKYWQECIDQADDIRYFLSGQRMIDHGHLKNMLYIYFYRCGDKLLIRWENDGAYTSESGQAEFLWSDFVKDIKEFFDSFLSQMQDRIDLAKSYDWGSLQLTEDPSKQFEWYRKRINQALDFMSADHYSCEYPNKEMRKIADICNDVIEMKYSIQYYGKQKIDGLQDRINDIHENGFEDLEHIDRFPVYEGMRILQEIISQCCQAQNTYYIEQGRKLVRRLPLKWVENNLYAAISFALEYCDEQDRKENIGGDIDRLTEMFCISNRLIISIRDYCKIERIDELYDGSDDMPMVMGKDFDRKSLEKRIMKGLVE